MKDKTPSLKQTDISDSRVITTPPPVFFDHWRLDPERGLLESATTQKSEKLPRKTVLVMLHLCENHGKTVSKNELIEHIWEGNELVGEQGVSNALWRIRKALDENADSPKYLETIPKVGYRWLVAPIVIEQDNEIKKNALSLLQQSPSRRNHGLIIVALSACIVLLGGTLAYQLLKPSIATHNTAADISNRLPQTSREVRLPISGDHWGIAGKWKSTIFNYRMTISISENAYMLEGTNNVFLHRGVIEKKAKGKFEADLADVEGWCCGTTGHMWIETQDDLLKIRSQWTSPIAPDLPPTEFGWTLMQRE